MGIGPMYSTQHLNHSATQTNSFFQRMAEDKKVVADYSKPLEKCLQLSRIYDILPSCELKKNVTRDVEASMDLCACWWDAQKEREMPENPEWWTPELSKDFQSEIGEKTRNILRAILIKIGVTPSEKKRLELKAGLFLVLENNPNDHNYELGVPIKCQIPARRCFCRFEDGSEGNYFPSCGYIDDLKKVARAATKEEVTAFWMKRHLADC